MVNVVVIGLARLLRHEHHMHFAIRYPEISSLSPRLFVSHLFRPWNCAHEFERPPAHVQVRDADAPMITYPPSNIPFCPMAPPLARSFPLTVSSPCFCLPRWHPTESSSSPLAYPIPVAPFSATSTDDRAYPVICERSVALDGCFSQRTTSSSPSRSSTLSRFTYYIPTANPGAHNKGTVG